MKIKINKEGYLEIERAGEFKVVECKGCVDFVEYEYEYVYGDPIKIDKTKNIYRLCGDWCAKFGEPEIYQDSDTGKEKIYLKLCGNNYLTCDIKDFIDKRK